MSSHPHYACSCPATDTSMAEHISARRFASLLTGKLVCFLTCELHAGYCWEPVNQRHVKLNLHRLLRLHQTLRPLTSLRLTSSHPPTGIDTCPGMLSRLLENLNLLSSTFFFFMPDCDVAVWVRACRGPWWFRVKLWVTTVALGVNVAEPLLHLLCPLPPGVVPSSQPTLREAWLMMGWWGWGVGGWRGEPLSDRRKVPCNWLTWGSGCGCFESRRPMAWPWNSNVDDTSAAALGRNSV